MIKNSEISLKTKKIIVILNSIIILFGIITFIGWLTGFDNLASIQESYIPMSRDTALFFILLGSISILLLNKKSENVIKLFKVIALFIAVYGSLKFIEYFIHFDLTFEDLWLPASEGTDLYPVKRMSPYTGFLYMFSGVSFFLSLQKNNKKVKDNISAIFGVIIFLLSFVAVTGYIFDSPLLYGSGIIPIAINTAVAFMFLGFSIILSTHNSYVVNYVTSNEILKTLLLTFIPLTTILIFIITLLTKVVLQNSATNIGLFTSLVCLITLFVVIIVIIPISKRITRKIDRSNADLLLAGDIFKNSIENAPIPIMIHAEDGTVLNISQEWTNLSKYAKSDIPTIFDWTNKAHGQDKEHVRDRINKQYTLLENQHDGEYVVNTKDGRHLIWDFNSISIGNLPDGRAVAMSVAMDVTEKSKEEENIKQLNKELNESQLLLNASLESPKDIIILSLDTEYRYMFFNKAHSTSMKLAYNADVTIGMCIFDFMTSKDDIKRIKENYDRALSGETHTKREQYGDLDKSYFEMIFSPIIDNEKEIIGISSFARNITEMTKANIKQKESEEKYRLLSDMLPLGMVHYSIVRDAEKNKIDFQILGINKVYEQLVGKNSSELIGRNLWDVFPQTEQYWIDEFEKVANSGKTSIFEDYSIAIDSYLKIYAYKIGVDRMAVIMEDVTENRRRQKEILYISYHDSLTDLHNRRYFEDNLRELDIPENLPLTIVMSDINGLKLINDAFGHGAGDKLLISASKVILSACRETDLIARIGGDEFVIAMPKTSGEQAEKIISKANKKAKKINIESIELSISFGFATKNNINENIQETFRSAEDLMYRVKLLEIPSMRSGAIETILHTLYEKDKNSEIHSRTVSEISEKIAKAHGMNGQEVNEVKTAGLLHDIGKIIIPISIIIKEGKLSTEEYELVKSHPEIGFRILNSTHDMRSISNIVLSHHERWDGLGYPRGIKAEDIPLQSRIISIADAFDAMTSARTYREIFTNEEALNEIKDNAGSQFDPELVKIFEEHFLEIIVD